VSGKTFEGQVARMGWEPGARPRPELVDLILDHHGRGQRRQIGPTLWGVALGALVGVLLKGLGLAGSPWGPESGLTWNVIATVTALGLVCAIAAVVWGVMKARHRPMVMQFASINLLTLGIVALA